MQKISEISFHVQVAYLVALVAGLFLTIVNPLLLKEADLLAMLFLVAGPALIIWAQRSSQLFRGKKGQELNRSDFARGPYKFTRHPTYIGTALLFIGFGFLVQSAYIVIFTLVAFLYVFLILQRREEKLLCSRYGDAYCEYQKKVFF